MLINSLKDKIYDIGFAIRFEIEYFNASRKGNDTIEEKGEDTSTYEHFETNSVSQLF